MWRQKGQGVAVREKNITSLKTHSLTEPCLGKAGVAEHADLVQDVVPLARRAHLLQRAVQLLAHLDDAPGHGLQLLLHTHALSCMCRYM